MPVEFIPGTTVTIIPPQTPIVTTVPAVPPDVITAMVTPPLTTPPPLVTPAPANDSVTVVPVVGPQGPPGEARFYEHQQSIPQAVWIVNHQLGRYPIAWSLFDTDGRLCAEYSVENVDANNCRISMDTPTAGVVRLI